LNQNLHNYFLQSVHEPTRFSRFRGQGHRKVSSRGIEIDCLPRLYLVIKNVMTTVTLSMGDRRQGQGEGQSPRRWKVGKLILSVVISFRNSDAGSSFIVGCRRPIYCYILSDHPQSSVVYNFSRVRLSVYPSVCLFLCVCNTITFESLDVGSSFSHIRYISREYGSSPYNNKGYRVTGQVKVTGAKKVENFYSRIV